MLAVIQWSWDPLLPPEQDLMRRLAVFTGGWTLERAAAVCSESGDEFEVLDLLTRLAERSLVVLARDARGGVRYRFLESVWRFALEKLEAHPEHAALRERHLAAYLEFAERSEKAMTGAGVQHIILELSPEEENILAALAWSARAEDGVQRGLRLAGAVSRFWSLLGRFALGRRVLEEALARDTARTPTPARAMTLVRAAGFELVTGDHAAARPHLEESLAESRAAGDKRGAARALAGDLGEERGVAMALHNLGSIEASLKRADHGRARTEAALEILRALEDRATEALCLSGVAFSMIRCGDLAAARVRMLECLVLLEELNLARESFSLLEVLAEWLFATGRAAESARVLGAAAGLRTALGAPALPSEREDQERMRSGIEAVIGAERARRSFAEGAALSREQALTEAKAILDPARANDPA